MVVSIINKNVLEALKELPDESVDCIITSPPYYSKRQYKGNDVIWGGDANCEHEWEGIVGYHDGLRFRDPNNKSIVGNNKNKNIYSDPNVPQNQCKKCGAWKGQLGHEPKYQMYIEHLMMVTKELKRILKKTGVLFWNIDDSSPVSGSPSRHMGYPDPKWLKGRAGDFDEPATYNQGIKPKSMMLLPERFALAMIDDGWILRNKIVWYKRNGQPNSTKDRFTRKWEYVFFFVKSKKYYFDLDSVRKPLADPDRMNRAISGKRYSTEEAKEACLGNPPQGLHKPRPNINQYKGKIPKEEAELFGSPRAREWRDASKQKYEETSSYPGKHSGYFNDDWTERINPKGANPGDIIDTSKDDDEDECDFWDITTLAHDFAHFAVFPETLVMPLIKSGCPVGGTVLDPFAGSGTTGVVAEILGRNSILVEISDEYVGIINERFKTENIEKVKRKLFKIKPKSNKKFGKVVKANKFSNLDNFIEVNK